MRDVCVHAHTRVVVCASVGGRVCRVSVWCGVCGRVHGVIGGMAVEEMEAEMVEAVTARVMAVVVTAAVEVEVVRAVVE